MTFLYVRLVRVPPKDHLKANLLSLSSKLRKISFLDSLRILSFRKLVAHLVFCASFEYYALGLMSISIDGSQASLP
jgi:hypothetical protein